MPYQELIKNFSCIRDYMREFYVCGFKCREEYTKKSPRTYDDEKRRLESLLGDYMRFRQTPEGKNVFISIDSRLSRRNPLYNAWKAKSFTDGDITLHFMLLDVLCSAKCEVGNVSEAGGAGPHCAGVAAHEGAPIEAAPAMSVAPATPTKPASPAHVPRHGLTLQEIEEELYGMLPHGDIFFDESTIRKKLKEYVETGIVSAEKIGRVVRYSLNEFADCAALTDALDFFSEAAPCGVIGSFLLDKTPAHDSPFAFKHHYITPSLDSEILCELFDAMRRKRSILLTTAGRTREHATTKSVVPLRIMLSVQNGRQYVMAYAEEQRRILPFRIDRITAVVPGEVCERFDVLRSRLTQMQRNMWGVSTKTDERSDCEHVEFCVRFADDEGYIAQRLEREKRCGTVECIDEHTCRFSADVVDAGEMIPWIRTFICRITELHFSNAGLERRFADDLRAMYALYGVVGEVAGNAAEAELRAGAGTEAQEVGVLGAAGETVAGERAATEAAATERAATERAEETRRTEERGERNAQPHPATKDRAQGAALSLFSELYGAYYNAMAAILREAISYPVDRSKIREIVKQYAFGESYLTIAGALRREDWPLLYSDGTTPICNVPQMPLTTLQKRWLRAIFADPRARLFGNEAEANSSDTFPTQTIPGVAGFPDLLGVEPLYTPEDVCVFDAYADGDNYADEAYVRHFRLTLDAVKKRYPLAFVVTNKKGAEQRIVGQPEYIEYSEKDDKFRVMVSGARQQSVVNLGRVLRCAPVCNRVVVNAEAASAAAIRPRQVAAAAPAAAQPQHTPTVRQTTERIVLEVTDERDALERALLHFAHFEKEAERMADGRYRVSLSIDPCDETEVLIRVLSFGPFVKVVEPESFVEAVKGRLRRQLERYFA